MSKLDFDLSSKNVAKHYKITLIKDEYLLNTVLKISPDYPNKPVIFLVTTIKNERSKENKKRKHHTSG